MRHNEEKLQEVCVKWWNLTFNSQPKMRVLLHHSPNGGFRNPREAARFKRMGTRPGFPDLVLSMKSKDEKYIGLDIEFKFDKGRQTEYQKLYQQAIEEQGHKYVVVRSFDQFKEVIKEYIGDGVRQNL